MDAEWKRAESALPGGWVMGGVVRGVTPMQAKTWTAEAFGPWVRSSRSRASISGYGTTPNKALDALAARLRYAAILDIDEAGF
jgi:hypothetical protein